MLQKHKDLDPKSITGKKLRTEGFYQSLAVNILLVLLLLLCYLLPLPKDVRLLVTILCALELPIFLIVLLVCRKKIFFVLTEDTLYFFHAEVELRKDPKSSKKTHYHGNGSIPLSEIRAMKVTYLYPHSTRRTPRLILEGETFTITAIGEGRYVMWTIRKAQSKLTSTASTHVYADPVIPETPPFTAKSHSRKDLFGKVWALFASDRAADFFDEGSTLSECIFREEDGMIDLIVTRNGQTVCFNIDGETVFMSDNDSDADVTVALSELTDLADLQSRMNHFIVTHTKSTLF